MTLKINGATGGSVSLDAPDNTSPAGTDVTLTLPVNDGDAGQFLQTDGTGALSWQDVTVPTSFDNIVEGNTTVECVDTGSDGHITFDTEGVEAARIDPNQRVFIGHQTSITGIETNDVQISTSGAADNGLGLYSFNSSGWAPRLSFGLSPNNTINDHTNPVGAGWLLGSINFSGSDGTQFVSATRIDCETDATVGANTMPSRLRFFIAPNSTAAAVERFRIESTGRVNFGAGPAGGTKLNIPYGSNDDGIRLRDDVGSGTFINFYANSSTNVGNITHTSSSTAYNTSSDYRLKENVVDLDGAIARVKQLAPKRFNFIADETDTLVDGFLAHEAQTVVPEAVTGTHNEVDDDGNAVMQGIDQSKLVPLLTAALQEAIAKIETLETRLTALEGGAA